jgi:hypothetical protein
MAEGRRPGGLTALAVINFVWGGIEALVTLGSLAVIGLITSGKGLTDANGNKVELPSVSVLYLLLLLNLVLVGLLIGAGVGYLKQKRVLGRGIGSTYGIISLATQVVGLLLYRQGFGIASIIGMIYPVLTLILLNTTFKDDLVN